jgi:hypothetical protein
MKNKDENVLGLLLKEESKKNAQLPHDRNFRGSANFSQNIEGVGS